MTDKQQTFQNILNDYQDKIYRLCCSYVTHPEDRKDLYQDIMLRIWKNLDSFREQSSSGTWVYRVSVNTSIDHLRKQTRKNQTTISIPIDDLRISDESTNIEQDYIKSERMRRLYDSMNTLSFLDKTLITLYLEDLSYRDISAVLGISEQNVGVRLHRVKKALENYLKDDRE